MKKKMSLVFVVVLLMMSLAGCGTTTSQAVEGTPVLEVNGDVITQEDINLQLPQIYSYYGVDSSDESLIPVVENIAIEGLIDQMLLLQEAERRGIKATKAETKDMRALYTEQYGSEAALLQVLEEASMSEKQFDRMLEEQIVIEKLIEQLTAEVAVDVVKAKHILVDDEEQAKAIIAELEAGADFATLAQEKSTDTASGAEGGELGYFTKNMMVEPFANASFEQEVGTFSKEPVQSNFGYHIILVEDKIDGLVLDDTLGEEFESIKYYASNEAPYNLIEELREVAELVYMKKEEVTEETPAEETPTEETAKSN